ncbi:MAG: spore cortex biosynthesis protein YabQ [Lachnospiraceae bacterium]|nr:spore cortex biosynthesis protein YabQ [Lachnospiraceae bacterium]
MVQELQTFFISAFWGMLVVVYYDFFRVIRGMKQHSTWMTAVEDILFCLGGGCLIVAVLYSYNQGQVRAFVLFGMGCGAALYNWGISPYSCGLVLFVYEKVKLALKKITKHSKINQKRNAKEGKDE